MIFLLITLFRKLIREGKLHVTDPAGKVHIFGQGTPQVGIRFHDRKSQWGIVRDAPLGAAEAFMNGTMTMAPGSASWR
jgi:cyclopropane-fatty-acyl-phospholipid synthase